MWMQTGSGKSATTKWGGGSISCKTSFKTEMFLVNKDNKRVNPTLEKGQYVFTEINAGDTIRYKVETGADSKKPASDKFTFVVNSINWTYLINIMNQMMSTATEEEIQVWNSNSKAYQEALAERIDMSRYIVTVFSELKSTNEEGIYEGSVKVPSVWASGPITISLFYGYDDDLTTSDFSRYLKSSIDTIGWIALGITVVAVTIGTLGIGGAVAGGIVAIGSSTAILAIDAVEISLLLHEQLTQGISAQIGRNKYGCSFPEGGYLHMYSGVVINPQNDPFQNISQETIPESEQQSALNIGGLNLNFNTILTVLGGAGLIILISSLVGDANE